MNIINLIDKNYGSDSIITFIKGLWDWQDKNSFQEELNDDGIFFLDLLMAHQADLRNYIVYDTFYKGLSCKVDDIMYVDTSSYTLSLDIAEDFADSEGNGDGLVIKKTGEGYLVNKIIDSIYEWMNENIETVKQELHISDINTVFNDYINEDEVISSIDESISVNQM